MSYKSPRIKELTHDCAGSGLDSRYVGFFRCFNAGKFFEAHEVLEDLWLEDRQSPDYRFYKGLIQLAGAFVHLEKERLGPAGALLKLAIANLEPYPAHHHALDARALAVTMRSWLQRLEDSEYRQNPLGNESPPRLQLQPQSENATDSSG